MATLALHPTLGPPYLALHRAVPALQRGVLGRARVEPLVQEGQLRGEALQEGRPRAVRRREGVPGEERAAELLQDLVDLLQADLSSQRGAAGLVCRQG